MAKKFPEIAESSEMLLGRMQKEKHVLKRQRLHTLYLVKSGQVGSRQEIAALLGVGGNAVGQWLNCYATDGLEVLMEVKVPPGRVATLNAAQQGQLREALARPTTLSPTSTSNPFPLFPSFPLPSIHSSLFHLV